MVRARPQWLLHALICTPAVRSAWGFSFPQCISHIVDLTTDTRWRYTTRCHPEHHEQGTDRRTLSESSLSRTQLLQVLSSAALSVFSYVSLPYPSGAALPTSEDYSFGTGSKLTRSRSFDETMLLVPPPPVKSDDLMDVLEAISGELDYMQTLVKKERWGDALARLKTFPLTALKSPTLGLPSVNEVSRSLGVPKARASEILEASVEAGLTLKQAQDVIFSNTRTSEYFNSLDLKQVQELKKNSTPVDITEPLQLLGDTKRMVDGIRTMMVLGPAT